MFIGFGFGSMLAVVWRPKGCLDACWELFENQMVTQGLDSEGLGFTFGSF